MIDPPEGFDARTTSYSQLSSPGTHHAPAPNQASMISISSAPPRKAVASRHPLELKYLQLEEDTTTNCLSTKDNSSRLEYADPILSTQNRPSRIQSMAGESTMAKPDTIVIPQDPSMEVSCKQEIHLEWPLTCKQVLWSIIGMERHGAQHLRILSWPKESQWLRLLPFMSTMW